ncbi:tRNA 2-thiouridine(34) synthase MnmA [Defluviicoccus vanus]|uniref:tRNA 2-thiouridine(34) synthase MnmA n=1 Tax=Defluviicoccus vanus TaxID=111831 RepID=UPI001CBA6478|nr:tRNA 2-thiouridine(34) synthase MnmA [Defluviicoccus vanus]
MPPFTFQWPPVAGHAQSSLNSLGIAKAPAATRVVVAMSGGVDSSATAALLTEQGYEVIGITLQLYDHGAAVAKPGACCAGQDIHDARRVADRLGIAHYVLDYEARFRSEVIDAFADAYQQGETPIPCVRCNQRVKFRDLLATAIELGADALATGHYVRRQEDAGGAALYRGHDLHRDQSYFLFTTTAAQLAYLRFPLGELSKDATRAIALRHGLKVAGKPDSQDICFVPTGNYAELLARLRPEAMQPGEIVDVNARVLGRHSGVGRFTVGQRRGIGIAAAEPLYVIRLEPEAGRVVVGPQAALARQHLRLREVNWLGTAAADGDTDRIEVKMRSTMAAVPATLRHAADATATVTLDAPFAAVAPGQACVFYQGDRLLGGGWICRDDAPTPAA